MDVKCKRLVAIGQFLSIFIVKLGFSLFDDTVVSGFAHAIELFCEVALEGVAAAVAIITLNLWLLFVSHNCYKFLQ